MDSCYHEPTESEIVEFIASWLENVGEALTRDRAIDLIEQDQFDQDMADQDWLEWQSVHYHS